MTTPARRPMPTWFLLGVALVYGLLLRSQPAPAATDVAPISYAWFAIVILIAQAIWTGVQAAAQITLAFLEWLVSALWILMKLANAAILDLGKATIGAFRSSWDFIKATYETVLKPGWEKFWLWIDRARKWLDDFFRPVFQFLREMRDQILRWYDFWIRPVLDSIDIARKILGVLTSLGIEWAKALDAELARLEEKISAPFLFALQQINLAIDIIDRVVTADGLFQRLALVRSIGRDIEYIKNQLVHALHEPLSGTRLELYKHPFALKPVEKVYDDTRDYLEDGLGEDAALINEHAADMAIRLRSPF